MSRADRRELLEAIAYSADPSLKPGDRLRALELLAELGDDGDAELDFRADLANLTGEQLDLELDAYLGGRVVASALVGERRFPIMEAALAGAIEERARALADADRIEAEVNRRAADLAEQMYVERGLIEFERDLGSR